jgi:hypothetical protein
MDGTYSTHVETFIAYEILSGKPQGRDYLRDLGADESVLLKGVLEKCIVKIWN